MQSVSGQASTSSTGSGSVKVAGNLAIAQIYSAEQSGELSSVSINVDYTGGADSLRARVRICEVANGKPGAVLSEVTSATKDVSLSSSLTLGETVPQVFGTSYAIVVDFPGGDSGGSFVWTAKDLKEPLQPCFTGIGSMWTQVGKVCDFTLGVVSPSMSADGSGGPKTQGRAPVQPGSTAF